MLIAKTVTIGHFFGSLLKFQLLCLDQLIEIVISSIHALEHLPDFRYQGFSDELSNQWYSNKERSHNVIQLVVQAIN